MSGVSQRCVTKLALLGLALLASACGPEPLSSADEERLQRVFSDLPQRQRLGIEQNLRFAGLYRGTLTPAWSKPLAEAVNTAHYELDYLDGKYALDTDAGAAAFLTALSGSDIRKRLASELSSDLPGWTQKTKPGTQVDTSDGYCWVDGGSYDRNGETAILGFSRTAEGATLELNWNGWPGGPLSQMFIVKFGNETWPMVGTPHENDGMIRVSLSNHNGRNIVDAIKRSTTVTIAGSSLTEPITLPVGDLYPAGTALEHCFRDGSPE